MSEHENIKILLEDKIKNLEQRQGEDNTKDEIEKFRKIYRLVTNQFNNFFKSIDINIAISILKDIGISQEQVMKTYEKLIKEELKKHYTLTNNQLNDEKEKSEEEK